ncbi:hypothetical protein GCM10023262_04900 [Bartonella pachyuromydis]|uniref:Uncharacterized protein n=1 Tax=Bartonella pachyuromydis TaxID=931097 RepID=A0ABP8VDF3_9HYPH
MITKMMKTTTSITEKRCKIIEKNTIKNASPPKRGAHTAALETNRTYAFFMNPFSSQP